MSALAAGVLVSIGVASLALTHPAMPAAAAARLPGPAPAARSRPASPMAAAGAVVRVLLPWFQFRPSADRRRGLGLIAGVALAVAVSPGAAVLPPVVAWAWPRISARRRWRDAQREVVVALPDTVDLLLLACRAGMSLPVAHPLVAHQAPPPVGGALVVAADAADAGRPRADSLVDALAPLGDRALALAHVLADHLRYGAPLAPALDRLGFELRIDRRRRAEQDARRVPVRLLAPLVTCVLPAFALLTVVPLLAASLSSLPT